MDVRAAVVAATLDELIESGYDALSVERVAERADLERGAVQDRWGDADALLALVFEELGQHELVLLNTGSLETDLRALAAGIAAFQGVPRLRAAFEALVHSAGRSPRAADSLRRFWEQRLARASEPVRRAIADGELPPDTDPVEVIRMLGAPFYYRMFVTREPLDDALAERTAAAALAAARAGVLTSG
jgi:AcrR family transcriptional regulator